MKPLCAIAAIAGLLLLPGCARVPEPPAVRTFWFDAIDSSELPLPALIVVDGDWQGAVNRNQYVNVIARSTLQIDLTFRSEEIEVIVVPIRVVDSRVAAFPKSIEEADTMADWLSQTRRLRADDPPIQMFVLQRRGS